MKIAFFGTSNFGEPTLKTLHQNFGVSLVVTAPPRPAKRGQKIQNTPIYEIAQILGIQTQAPEKITEDFTSQMKIFDYIIVVSYGKIIPQALLKKAKIACLNLHPSALPLFRGAAPIERTIESGAQKTEICIIKMTKELDAGNIVLKQDYTISTEENSIELHRKFSKIGANLMLHIIKNGIQNETPQRHEDTTYAKKIQKNELELKVNASQNETLNKIRAFASYGFCYTIFNGKRFKIIKAKKSSTQQTPIDIPCKDGFITPSIIRPEGKKDIKIEDYQF